MTWTRGVGRVLAGCAAFVAGLAPTAGIGAPSEAEVGPVAMPPLVTQGELPPRASEQLQQRLLDGMADARFEIVEPDAVVRAHPAANHCTSAECIQAVASALGTGAVLRATVRFEHRDYELLGELIAADGVTVLVRVEDQCDLCGIDEAGGRLAGLAASIRRKLDADARARPRLNVTSQPAGAMVLVDGVAVGVSPVELALAPGTHDIRVEKAGFTPRDREVELVLGVHESISVELSASAGGAVEPDRGPGHAWVGWSVVGGGGVLTVVGATLLAFHTQPIRRKCTGANVDMDGTCRFNHNTIVPGVVIGAGGLALLGTGIALAVARRKRIASSGTVAFGPGPRGLAIRF